MFLNPTGFLSSGTAAAALKAGRARPLSDTGLAFTGAERLSAVPPGVVVIEETALTEISPDELAPLSAPRAPFAGLSLDRPRIMGIVNVTPDSFSDGGDYADPERAKDRALALAEQGADIVDIGGESTRPGAAPTPVAEEIDRVMPVAEAALAAGLIVSIDTRRAEVMRTAAAAGVQIVNDVTAFTHDPDGLGVAARHDLFAVLMHIQGTPATMQQAPAYRLASYDVCEWLGARVAACAAAGIGRDRLAVDPGIGFGKTDAHNMEILDRFAMLHGLGCAVMAGVSRKSFIGRIAGIEPPKDRLPGSIAATLIALSRGVQLHRVHDVAATRQAVDIWNAMLHGA